MTKKGILVVVSGFSGVGKGTLMNLLVQQHHEYALSISATTRSPRPGEKDGREYFFIGRDVFEEMIRTDRLIEYAEYCGNYYGTPRDYVETQLEKGQDVILEIEVQGAMKIRKMFPDALLVYIMPPDVQTLVNRLYGRGSEDEAMIQSRLLRAVQEAEGIESYDAIIVNDDLDESVAHLHHLIESQYAKISRNTEFIREIRTGIRQVAHKFMEEKGVIDQ